MVGPPTGRLWNRRHQNLRPGTGWFARRGTAATGIRPERENEEPYVPAQLLRRGPTSYLKAVMLRSSPRHEPRPTRSPRVALGPWTRPAAGAAAILKD